METFEGISNPDRIRSCETSLNIRENAFKIFTWFMFFEFNAFLPF